MKPATAVKLAAGMLLATSTLTLAGCYVEPYHRPGPPPHAPAHGYRWHQYDYFYYPSVGVYFNIYSGTYYYRDGHSWRHSTWLPPKIVIQPRERVQIRIQDKHPWKHDWEYRERYRTPSKRLPSREEIRQHDRQERDYHHRLYEDSRRQRR